MKKVLVSFLVVVSLFNCSRKQETNIENGIVLNDSLVKKDSLVIIKKDSTIKSDSVIITK
jgi:hypothetical protein